jgi:DNA-binding transcriptional regulator YiaG
MPTKQSIESSPAPAEIIQRRTENNLSQVAAARTIPGVSVSTWRAWEYGQNPMHPGLWELFTLKLLMQNLPKPDRN